MLCEYSHTKSKSFAQIYTAMAEIQHFFSRGLFFIGAPCIQTSQQSIFDSKKYNIFKTE